VATSCKNCRASLVPDMVATPKTIPAAVAPGSSNAKLVVMVSLALFTTAVGAWWWSAQGAPSAPVTAQVAPVVLQTTGLGLEATESSAPAPEKEVVSTEAASVAAAEAQATRIKQQAAAVVSADKARRIRERKEKEARELAAAEKQRAAQVREQLQAEQARRRAEETARQKAGEAAALAAAKPPPPVQTVDTVCASSSNFIAREVCRTRECRNPAFTNDPVCVRFRQVEAANRRQPQY
jgi:type IV secretory pathway VirB10-like protein